MVHQQKCWIGLESQKSGVLRALRKFDFPEGSFEEESVQGQLKMKCLRALETVKLGKRWHLHLCRTPCYGVPKTTSVLVIHWEDSQNSEKLLYLWLIKWKDADSNLHRIDSGRNQTSLSGITQTVLNSPNDLYDNEYKLLPERESHHILDV